jgi:hypothetical protein
MYLPQTPDDVNRSTLSGRDRGTHHAIRLVDSPDVGWRQSSERFERYSFLA